MVIAMTAASAANAPNARHAVTAVSPPIGDAWSGDRRHRPVDVDAHPHRRPTVLAPTAGSYHLVLD